MTKSTYFLSLQLSNKVGQSRSVSRTPVPPPAKQSNIQRRRFSGKGRRRTERESRRQQYLLESDGDDACVCDAAVVVDLYFRSK